MLLLTTLCISVFSKSIHSLFSNTAPLRLSLSHWSQTQCRVSLKVMWSPKSSRLVASKVVGRKKREEAAYVTRGSFGNVWGMLSVCHNDWVNVKDGPLKLKIVLHKMSLTSTYETLKE